MFSFKVKRLFNWRKLVTVVKVKPVNHLKLAHWKWFPWQVIKINICFLWNKLFMIKLLQNFILPDRRNPETGEKQAIFVKVPKGRPNGR